MRAIAIALRGVTDERVYRAGGTVARDRYREHDRSGRAQKRASAVKIPGVTGERGVALALAVFALVVVGALVAAACLAGTLEQRSGRNTVYAAEAADAAESGNATTLGTWDATLNALAPGDSTTRALGSAGPRTTAASTVIRLNEQLFLVRSVGRRTDANGQVLARRTVAIVGRQLPESLTTSAALAVGRPLASAGAALRIVGEDEVPEGWTGCAPLADQAAVRSATTTGIAGEDTTHLAGIPGRCRTILPSRARCSPAPWPIGSSGSGRWRRWC